MNRRGVVRVVFVTAFVLLLLDGAAAIWLGQLWGRPILVLVGLLLVAASAFVPVAYRRWVVALDAIEAARRELHDSINDLRSAAADARANRWHD